MPGTTLYNLGFYTGYTQRLWCIACSQKPHPCVRSANSLRILLSDSYAVCPELQGYSCDIFSFLFMILEVQVVTYLILITLGISDKFMELNVAQWRLLACGVIIVKNESFLIGKTRGAFHQTLASRSDRHSPFVENQIHLKRQAERFWELLSAF